LLLQGQAHTWWNGVKNTATNWEAAKELLRDEYAPRPPEYQVYLDIFSEKQDHSTPTTTFIAKKRALFSLLDTTHDEKTQINMICVL
jgi:hypothetical protein